MGTISEIFNKKSMLLLGRPLLSPAAESNPSLPKQLDLYLCTVSREIYFGRIPIEFDSSTMQVGEDIFIRDDGKIVDEYGNKLFDYFDQYLLASIEPTLLFIDSFVST